MAEYKRSAPVFAGPGEQRDADVLAEFDRLVGWLGAFADAIDELERTRGPRRVPRKKVRRG